MALTINEVGKNFTVKFQRLEYGPYEFLDVQAQGRDDARTQVQQANPGITILDCYESNRPNPYAGRL